MIDFYAFSDELQKIAAITGSLAASPAAKKWVSRLAGMQKATGTNARVQNMAARSASRAAGGGGGSMQLPRTFNRPMHEEITRTTRKLVPSNPGGSLQARNPFFGGQKPNFQGAVIPR